MNRVCVVNGCGKTHSAKGFCATHYTAYRKWGIEEMSMNHHSYASKGMVKKHDRREYVSWSEMKRRCNNKKHKSYPNYGGRGIGYTRAWNNFDNFFADMGVRPEGTTLERKDNEKDYSVDNCKWATPREQSRNKRNNVKIGGELLKDLLGQRGIMVSTFYARAKSKGIKPESLWIKEYGK